MNEHHRDRLAIGSALLLWLVGFAGGVAPLRLVAGACLVYVAPGLAVQRLLRVDRQPVLEQVLHCCMISPFALGLVAWLATLGGRPIPETGLAALLLYCAVVLWPEPHVSPIAPEASPGGEGAGSREWLVPLVSLGAGALAVLGYLNPWVLNWSDGWAHAAIFEEILRGGIPPQFPHFAGHAMPYAWYFHVFLASTSSVMSRDPFLLMASLNVWTAILFPLGLHALARSAGLSPSACRWSAVAGLVGMNPAGGLWLLATGTLGETAGPEWLSHGLSSTNHVLTSLAFRFPYFQATLYGRLWTPTAFMFALVLACVVLRGLVEFWNRPTARRALALLAFLTLLFLWHPLTALQTSLGIALAVPLAALLSPADERRSALARTLVIAAAGLAALALVLPYLRIATGGTAAGQMARLRLSAMNTRGLLLSMGPLLVLAVPAVAKLDTRRRWLMGGLLLGLLSIFLLMDAPGTAEEKYYLLPFAVAAALAGSSLAAWSRRGLPWRIAIAAFVVSGLATTGLTAWAFIRDPRSPRELFAPENPAGGSVLTRDEAAAIDWIRTRAPREAVFVQFPRPSGPEPILVLGRRRLYLGAAEALYRAAFMPRGGEPPVPLPVWTELQRREALQLAVFSDRDLAPDSLAMLRSSPWPLVIWWDASLGGGKLSPSLSPEAGATRPVFTTPTVRLLEILPTR